MSNINRDYLIILDVKSGEVDSPNIYYFNTDKNTSNLYVQMVIKETSIEAAPIDNANNYSIKANILKPNMVGKIVEGNLVNEAKAIYEFKLPADCTDFSGNAKIEFEVYCTVDGVEEIATSFATKFKVHGSVLTEQNKYIEDSSDYPILKDLMAEVKVINETAHELDTTIRTLQADMIDANNEMKTNEATRQANEEARKEAERTRATNETDRVEAEKQREIIKQKLIDDIKTYLDDYKNEKDNIINSKIEELNRTTYNIEESEKDRVKNETLRQNSESTRSKEFETIKSDYETYKNVMISESNVAALQNQINNNSSQIKENTNDLGSLQVKVDSLASGNPKGVYPTLNDLKNDYPSGNNNIYIVSDDGSWCYWNGTDWIKGGIYQGVVVADKSITPSKNVNTYMPRYKDLESYTTNNTETSLFVNNIILEKGIMNLMCKSKGGSVTFFHLEKENDNTFNVIDKYTTTLIEGINTVLTNFLIKGNGNEYLGFIGNIQFKKTSSNGYYELQNATSSQNTFFVPFNSDGKNFDFAIYETYENAILVDEILKKINENKVDDKINKSLSFPYGDTVIKDLSSHNYTCENKLYIPNIPVKNGYVKIHIKCTQNDLGYFYAFDKDTDNFIVKKVISQSLEEGENIIDMPYEFKGDGTEYIGFYTTAYYKTSGGTGFYESSKSLLEEGNSITPQVNISNGLDFAVYYEYYNKNFKDSIIELKQDTKDLKTIINNIDEKLNNNIPYIKLTDFSLPKYSEIEQQVGFFGRWFEKEIDGVTCKCTINQGSELYFKVKGATKVDLIFKINTDLETPYFAYSIDGDEFTRQLITTSTINLPSTGEHIIRVVIDGITENEYKWISEKSVAFEKAVVDSGTIKGIIPKNRKIIFYGDSITDGINVLNSSATADGNSAIGAFPFITCKNLNSISYRVGFGSTGVTKGGSGKVPKCLTVIDNMTSNREEQYIEPDLIVINHGTNDPKSTDEDSSNFINEYNQVLERLRIKYPGVLIFAVIPFRQFHADDIRACVSGKEWVYLIETQDWNVPYTDGVHPNVEGSKIAGEKLSLEILKVLGKDYFIK